MIFVQIQVRFKDGREEVLDSPNLEDLVASGEISHFRRSHGWVSAADAETRGTSKRTYAGNEKRRDLLSLNTVFTPSRLQEHESPSLSVSDLVSRYWCMMRGESCYW